MNRRNFLQKTAFSAATLGLTPLIGNSYSSVFGQTAPSNKVKVALIGCRSMGYSNLNTFLDYPEVECVALCDIDDEWLNKRAADVEKKTGKKVANLYKDWRHVIDNKDIDAVIIGTPDHWHCLPMIWAAQAGKDVYVEKPLSNTIEECDLMLKAARKYNRVVQVGQWQRSDPHWNEAAAYLRAGNIGRIRTVKVWAYQDGKPTLPVKPDSNPPAGVDYDMWLGPAPKRPFNEYRFHYNFRFFWDYAGGLMSDWGVHLLDYALEGMGASLPSHVFGSGGKFAYPTDAMETPDTLMATYAYKDFNIIWDHACGVNHGLFDKKEGLAFYGENGTMLLTRAGWEVMPVVANNVPRMEAVPFKKGEGKGLYNHVGNFLSCIKSRQLPAGDIEIGARVAKMSHLANISCRLQREVHWDDAKSMFVNDSEANALAKAYYRAPWELPKL
ncbi:putative dehydrogenase [Parabacteroides sp. PF5-5]|uniref:Gfo/Idh/MocA family protein n=1 Tax=unclassified Parabacteroides TaxID=2649774 RepID=UPI0024746791|nr:MULTISPECIES: Gfo/Idh/MocA family oxidoreductase [unclassified Parabacteroides]MDH6305855.1 putative dehydrogenase [Parabacteroides sp. PH5-39]MDH6317331.1 putative dehydrogenase [Parabacteroides sp. PF5-13]MDH6320539.1 putative dehydrogenase [Parabacteroides sp. PH5-13]MDH6324298.1 putative dehydrogenase [Parabacteroides sp. PH5-8]MDH6328495.1 putative dehydrogenase [Parabacteroides sp. PH5-41]